MNKGVKMRILVIINPYAGNRKTVRLLPEIKKWLSQNPHEFLWCTTQSPDEMRTEILNSPAKQIDAILLVGGDGTVHEALPAVRKTGLPFGLVPCGRGNDFARNVGLSLNLESNCAIPSELTYQQIDLPTINDAPFGSIACLGFDAEVNKLAREKKGYFGGTLGYIICVVKALKGFTPFEIEIQVDDFSWHGRIMMVAIANGQFYGGGMKIAPNALVNDGRFDVCIIEEVSKVELLKNFPKVFRGTHIAHPKIIMKSGKTVKIFSDENRQVFADGEYVGNTPAVCLIGDQRVRVIRTHAEF